MHRLDGKVNTLVQILWRHESLLAHMKIESAKVQLGIAINLYLPIYGTRRM